MSDSLPMDPALLFTGAEMSNGFQWLFDFVYQNKSAPSDHGERDYFSGSAMPFSTTSQVLLMLVLYLSVIFVLREWMRCRKPFAYINTLFVVHNYLLSSVSLVLLLFLLERIVPSIYNHGFVWTICSKEMMSDSTLLFLYYVNYLVKFYELLDTVFLVIKKRPLEFLHVYHHSATFTLCYTQIVGNITVVRQSLKPCFAILT